MYNIKVISVRKNLIQGYSSVGRAAVSKTACRGFKSFCPCQKKHRFFGAFFLYLRLFTPILLAFPTQIKLRRTVFSVRRFFIFAPLFVHFVPHNPPIPFGTSSKKHQSQFKSVCNAHQHIRVSFDMLNKKYVYQK